MRNVTCQLVLVLVLVGWGIGGPASADDQFPSCWRNQTGSTFQNWSFDTSPNPAAPESAANPNGTPQATAAVGSFGSGWIAQFPPAPYSGSPPPRNGLWDLGRNGTMSLTIPNQAGPGYKEISVQVTQLLTPPRPVSVSIPGATFLHGQQVVVASYPLSQVVVTQSTWRLPSCPASETITLTADATSGSVIDQVVVETLCVDFPCPSDLTANTAPGQCDASVGWSVPAATCPVASVACTTNNVAVTNPTVFPAGQTLVNCLITDVEGHGVNCAFNVTVIDTQPPVITCPGNLLVMAAAGATSSVVHFTPAFAADNCAVTSTNCSPPSGSAFLPGETTVTCTVSDAATNTSSPCSFTITIVQDNGPACLLVWKFDEAAGLGAADSSGNTNLGKLFNGPVRATGVVGRALRFDGSDDRVSATNGTSLNVTSAFTVACWVKPESASDSRYLVIKGDSSDKKYAYGLRTSNGKLQYRWVSPSGSESVFQTTGTVLTNGRWTHVAAAHLPGSVPGLFINGVAVPGSLSSGSATALIRPSSNPFSVGAASGEHDEFKGTIDEVFVCLSKLTAGQIQNLTNGLPPGPPPPPPVPGIVTANPLPGGVTGTAYSQTLMATGGTPGFIWSLVSGAFPAGLTLNTNTGAITGTPAIATTNTLRVRVRDTASQAAEKDFTLAITAPPPCVVHYKFDETSGTTALDSSGNNNHGTLVNGPVRTNGMVNGALRFDGSNDRVNGGNASSFSLTGPLTLAAWIRPESVSGTRMVMIKGKLSDKKYAWALLASSAKLQYRWVNPGGNDAVYQSANNVLTPGLWTHLAVVHTPGSAPLLYTNGMLVPSSRTSGSATAAIGVTSNPFTVGSSSDGSERFLGIIDEAFVCRVAVVPADLVDLMNGQPPASAPPVAPSPLDILPETVAPIIVKISASQETATIGWTAVPGLTYTVQFKNALEDLEWVDLVLDVFAYDTQVSVADAIDGQQRFYRVVVSPP